MQASEKVADIRSKLEKGLAGPRAYSDSYCVNGHRIYVYPPRQAPHILKSQCPSIFYYLKSLYADF